MLTKEDIEKIDVNVVNQDGLGITVDITFEGKPIKRVVI